MRHPINTRIWTRWFAWYPIRTEKKIVWMDHVYRKEFGPSGNPPNWFYRSKDEYMLAVLSGKDLSRENANGRRITCV